MRGPQDVDFPPSFEIGGDLTFQPLGAHRAFFNGDLALKASELNAVIDTILANGLVFQAMHQHYFDLDPMVWFIHFRGQAAPLTLARRVRKVLDATAIPLPQKLPANPTTPLDHAKLAKTLHGSSEIGDDGVVVVTNHGQPQGPHHHWRRLGQPGSQHLNEHRVSPAQYQRHEGRRRSRLLDDRRRGRPGLPDYAPSRL